MEFKSRSSQLVAGLLAVASSAVLFWFGTGLDPFWPLLWFAPLPVLLFALRNSAANAAVVAALALLLGSLNLWGYLRLQGAPFWVWLLVFSIAALAFAAGVALFRALALRGHLWASWISLPAVWVSYEFIRNLATPHATAADFAYTQLKFLPFLQLASVAGPWGMGFVLLLFPCGLALGISMRSVAPRRALLVTGATFAFLTAVLGFGTIRLLLPDRGEKVTVGLIATDGGVAKGGAPTHQLFQGYAEKAAELTRQGATVVVLPEKLGVVSNAATAQTDETFQPLADATGATLVVGDVRVLPQAAYNEARIYTPGATPMTYDKHHLLPPFESDLIPGTERVTLPRASQTWGVAICKDMDFTPLSRQYGRSGVGLMLVPGWDFNVDRAWHGHMAIMRGVEDGFNLVRAAKNGYLTVSDSRGRVIAEARSDSAPFATLLTQVPATHTATLYLLLGDWFGWFAILLVLLAVLQLFRGSPLQGDRLAD
ncbi:MAG TPA: nitrilase-related carbon-nitrogen hydrolase [Acidobacteriaceae bacterium]|jgi:apolipoprotein N-acyltransferase